MLPNHAPLAVAEQFALLEAALPGRIDLGLGRAPGTDPVTSCACARRRRRRRRRGALPRVRRRRARADVAAGVSVAPHRGLHAEGDPAGAVGTADLAARLVGLLGPAGRGQGPAVRLRAPLLRAGHRRGARGVPLGVPALGGGTPSRCTFMTVNAVVAHRAEAEALLLPNLQMMARLRTGQPLSALDLVEDAAALTLAPQAEAIVAAGLQRCGRRRTVRGGRSGACHRRGVRRRRGDGQPGGLRAPRHRPPTAPRPVSPPFELLAKELSGRVVENGASRPSSG